MLCRCGCSKTEADPSSGTTYCVACGEVLEENTIVAEVTFQELSGGKTVLSGSFAGESGRIATSGPFGRGRGKEGQEQAMDNGRYKIARLAHGLQLPERYRESAQRYYNLAVVNGFTKGRKTDHVAAVCLYIVCRNEKSSQMLIDFSDLLQVNVFVLGAVYLKFVRTLHLKLPLIDPSIYISRFAAALDFGEYTQRVAQDAVRLVQRMDRDWIRTGRRPAGICGACLLIAARINGFRRTTREMIYVVKVAEITINQRLKEFKETESANLSVRDFRTMWLEKEADPPAFTKARKEQEKNSKDKELSVSSSSSSSSAEEEEDTEDQSRPTSRRLPIVIAEETTPVTTPSPSVGASTPGVEDRTQEESQSSLSETLVPSQSDDATQATLVNPTLQREAQELEKEMNEWMQDGSFIKATESLEREIAEKTAADEASTSAPAEEENLSDVDDEEIDAMLLSPEEIKLKTTIWYTANKDYIEEMKAKARKIEMDKQNGVYTKRGQKKGQKRKRPIQASTPAEAAKQLVQSKKLSKKINQEVFDHMFESPESIAKIKERDRLQREMPDTSAGGPADYSSYEVVEESGDTPAPKRKRTEGPDSEQVSEPKDNENAEEMEEEEEDEEEIDLDDMADDERLMMEQRKRYGFDVDATEEDYYDYDEEY